MTDVAAKFAPARKSVSIAKEAVNEFDAACAAFFQDDITEIITEIDANTSHNVQKLRLRTPLPISFDRKATEAANSAKNAFDQATFAARNLTSGFSRKTIYYPWAESRDELEHVLKHRGIDQRLWNTFRKHEPYARGNNNFGSDDRLRRLATMVNRKHTIGLSINCQIMETRTPRITGTNTTLMIGSPTWDPEKNEAEIIRWSGGVLESQGNYQFSFEVVFKDTCIAQPMNAGTCLKAFVFWADGVIESLETRCLEMGS